MSVNLLSRIPAIPKEARSVGLKALVHRASKPSASGLRRRVASRCPSRVIHRCSRSVAPLKTIENVAVRSRPSIQYCSFNYGLT
jgi:hypothetical protein